MVSLPTTNELISAFWNNSLNEEDKIFSVLNDDHSAFLGDGEYIPYTSSLINKKREAAALVIQNCWFKYKRKKVHSYDQIKLNYDSYTAFIELQPSRSTTTTKSIINTCAKRSLLINSDLKKFKTNVSISKAVSIIQRNFRSYLRRKIFYQLMETLYELLKTDPIKLLKRVNSIESQLFEKTKGNTLIFRFAGETFPPQIVYKVFTNRSVVNINSSWRVNVNYKPKDKKSKLNSKSITETPSHDWKLFYSYRKTNVTVPGHQESSIIKQLKYKNKHYKRSKITWIRDMYHI